MTAVKMKRDFMESPKAIKKEFKMQKITMHHFSANIIFLT